MQFKVTRADTWAATIVDRPGGLAQTLEPLTKAKANLEFIIARRSTDQPGKGVVFLTPLKGSAQLKAAKEAGFQKTNRMFTIRLEGTNKPGLASKVSNALAAAGINMRGFSAAAIGGKGVAHIALDTKADATKAVKILKSLR